MEQQQHHLSNSTTEHLLNEADTEANDISLEFIKQNDIISKEILKHDQLLRTCPMIILRTWIILYSLYGFSTSLFLLILIPNLKPADQIGKYPFYFIIYSTIFILLYSVYGTFILWRGISTRDLFKVERSLSIFKIYLSILTIAFLFAIVYQVIVETWTWISIIGCMLMPAPILINFLFAKYVKKILIERDVFCQVSSNYK